MSNIHKPYTLGTFKATEEMRSLVSQVLESGRISYGPFSHEFEESFAEIHGCPYGILVSSGTAALQVALQAMKELHGWQDGDEVLVPSLTFVATINIVYHCRMKPVLVDVDPVYYAINPEKIEDAIKTRTRCIIPVHPFGLPADMPTIGDLVYPLGLKVIEDSCEAMFVDIEDNSVGSWGDVGCFSTYVAHILTTGVGGICTTHNRELALRMRSLANHGIDVSNLPSSDSYDPSHLARNFLFTSIGHSFRVTELEAALGLAQLKHWPEMMEKRVRNAHLLHSALKPYEEWLILPSERPNAKHAYMVFPIVMRSEDKGPIMTFLRGHGVECRDMLPLTSQPCYNFLPFIYPVSQNINHRGFYIGCHQDLEPSDITEVAETFGEFFADRPYPEVDFGMGAKSDTQS